MSLVIDVGRKYAPFISFHFAPVLFVKLLRSRARARKPIFSIMPLDGSPDKFSQHFFSKCNGADYFKSNLLSGRVSGHEIWYTCRGGCA